MEITDQDLRHAQSLMISIMESIHNLCTQNGIKYWVDFGTLIGAVRHNGFIPWDDDFDICMLRDDYERFDKLAKQELDERLFWQTYHTDKRWCSFHGKVRLKNTIWLEECFSESQLKENGLFVDVFPLDNTFENKILREIHFFVSKIFVALGLLRLYNKKDKIVFRLFSKMIPTSFIMATGLFIIKFKDKRQSKYVTSFSLGSTIAHRNLIYKSVFDKVILHQFERTHFFIPEEYHTRLKYLFGDYMTPPPLDKCKGHHNITSINFGRY